MLLCRFFCPAGQNTTSGCGPVSPVADQGTLEEQDGSDPVCGNGTSIGNKQWYKTNLQASSVTSVLTM
eukprot:15327227-Ditylum_brightwellii.AAC.1